MLQTQTCTITSWIFFYKLIALINVHSSQYGTDTNVYIICYLVIISFICLSHRYLSTIQIPTLTMYLWWFPTITNNYWLSYCFLHQGQFQAFVRFIQDRIYNFKRCLFFYQYSSGTHGRFLAVAVWVHIY